MRRDNDQEDSRSGQPGEINPYNRDAVRGRDGVWNQNILPITDWEDPHRRIVVPTVLRDSLRLQVPDVLRWDQEKYRSVTIKHAGDLPVIMELTRHLANWRFHGEEVGAQAGNQRILFQDHTGRWYAVSIGPLAGSDNIITIAGSRRSGFLSNRLSGMKNVVERRE